MGTVEARIKALKLQRQRAYVRHEKAVRAAQERFHAELQEITAKLATLEKAAKEPRVLVRNGPGPEVNVYHSAEKPCGKVNPDMVKVGRYDELPLSEALDRGLKAHGCARRIAIDEVAS